MRQLLCLLTLILLSACGENQNTDIMDDNVDAPTAKEGKGSHTIMQSDLLNNAHLSNHALPIDSDAVQQTSEDAFSETITTDSKRRLKDKLIKDASGNPVQRLSYIYSNDLVKEIIFLDIKDKSSSKTKFAYDDVSELKKVTNVKSDNTVIILDIKSIDYTNDQPIYKGRLVEFDGTIVDYTGNPFELDFIYSK